MTGGTTLLDRVALGLHALSCRDSGSPVVPPYPEETQYALDCVVYECLRHNHTPPAGLPELIRWCTNLASPPWPFALDARLGGLALVEPRHRTRTRACAELAGLATVSDTVIAETLSELSASDAAQRRRFLRSHVLVGPDTHRQLLMADPSSAAAYKFVKDLYRPASAEWIVSGRVALCECGALCRPQLRKDWLTEWCEREACPPGNRVAQSLPAARALVLHPALRLFVALPAPAEDRLRAELATAECPVRAAGPSADRYEIRFPGDEPRTFRFYDRIMPTVLARDAVADGVDIAVVPDSATSVGMAGRRAFADALPPGAHVTLATVSELLARTTADGGTADA